MRPILIALLVSAACGSAHADRSAKGPIDDASLIVIGRGVSVPKAKADGIDVETVLAGAAGYGVTLDGHGVVVDGRQGIYYLARSAAPDRWHLLPAPVPALDAAGVAAAVSKRRASAPPRTLDRALATFAARTI
jgi:hypothetical protein